jgi:hypothetical protein
VLPESAWLPLSVVGPGLSTLFVDVAQLSCTGPVELATTTTVNEPAAVGVWHVVPLASVTLGTVTLLTWLGGGEQVTESGMDALAATGLLTCSASLPE